jgi:hypothetical protein
MYYFKKKYNFSDRIYDFDELQDRYKDCYRGTKDCNGGIKDIKIHPRAFL